MDTPRDMRERAANDRGDAADDLGDASGSVSTSERDPPDDLERAIEARVIETLFGSPARPPTLGRYVVLGTLGQGGMGTVLEAFDHTLDRKVAIKVLHEDLDDTHTARLLREARAMAKLSHPNVVPVFEADTAGDQTFVVMELVQGQTLRDWIRQQPRPDWRQCVEMFIQVGQGLAAAHAEGLVHRDFKPSNAIVDDEGRARVLDFGLARRIDVGSTDGGGLGHQGGPTEHDRALDPPAPEHTDSPAMHRRDDDALAFDPLSARALTKTGIIVGTPAYMPPEQVKGREADARSDQFSFCVSLYEAVYGERPFEGSTLTGRMDSMTRNRVRPAPKSHPVPARLRALLLRGLAARPEERWPSMDALLHQLRTLLTPRTRRWMAMGLTAGLAMLGGGLALGQYVEAKERCTGARAQMDGIWDDDRRRQVRGAILGTERSFAPGTWERLEAQLDAYAQDWLDTHTEVCKATSVRGEQSDEALDLRMHCLGQRRTALRATIDVLADADANTKVVDNAITLVASLPTLTRCDDLAWLERHNQRVPPPEDPDVAAAVQAQRAHLATLKAMYKAGRYADALDALEAVVQQAQRLDYPPLRAEALSLRGALREGTGQYAEAEEDLRQAHALATEHHHDPIALDTAQLLTSVVGVRLARHAEGRQWGQMVALPLAQRSDEPYEEARSLFMLGNVFNRHGDLDNALDHHQRALALWDKALGPDHPYVANSLMSIAFVFHEQGDLDEARAHLQRALAIKQKTLGPDHIDVATILNNLGIVLNRQGDLDNARVYYERALARRERALGPDHPDVAGSLNNLGILFYDRGDLDKARAHLERALTIKQAVLGPDHPDLAGSLGNLGNVLLDQGDLDNARRHLQRSLVIREKALGPDHPDLAYPLVRLATMALDTGASASARAHAERAISVLEAASVGPPRLAEARFVLAQALWHTHREQTRARALAEQAREVLATAESLGHSRVDLADVDAWLATHHVQ
ncbi:MAG: serine/threonine-protein kinase [Myxococcota bacterium]